MRTLILTVAALCAATPLLAQEEPAERPQERIHTVRPGDTLWDLARQYLRDPFLWPEIFRLNPDVIGDPARIYPSERLRIPWLGNGLFAFEEGEPERTIFFPRNLGMAREAHTIRAAGTADVPILTAGDFYRAAFLAHDREVAPAGRIVRRISPTVVPVEMPAQIALYDRVVVSLSPQATARVGELFQFFRRDRPVRGYGRVWEPTGLAEVVAVEDGAATAVIVQVFDAITVGDLALGAEEFPVEPGVAPRPQTGVTGRVIAFQRPNPLQTTQAIVFLDLGAQAGLEAGDEFVAYLPATQRRGEFRPEIEVALLQVVRVKERTAAARVLELRYPALEPGLPVRLVAKMP